MVEPPFLGWGRELAEGSGGPLETHLPNMRVALPQNEAKINPKTINPRLLLTRLVIVQSARSLAVALSRVGGFVRRNRASSWLRDPLCRLWTSPPLSDPAGKVSQYVCLCLCAPLGTYLHASNSVIVRAVLRFSRIQRPHSLIHSRLTHTGQQNTLVTQTYTRARGPAATETPPYGSASVCLVWSFLIREHAIHGEDTPPDG